MSFIRACLYATVERLIRWAPHPKVRARLLGACGASIGSGARVEESQFYGLFRGFRNLTLGAQAFVGPRCLIDLTDRVTIGARSSISPSCSLLTHADPGSMFGNALSAEYPRKTGPITIGADCWIGAGAIILCGVTIGDRSVVGAGAVVLRDILTGAVVVGNPARAVEAYHTARRLG